MEPVVVAGASPPPIAAAAAVAPRKRDVLLLVDGEFFRFENPTIFILWPEIANVTMETMD